MTLQPKRDRRSMVEHKTERAPGPRPVRAVPDFESFYRSEYRSVVGLAYALSGSRIAAEDITQDAFLAAHKEWDRVAAYDRPEAWVRRVVSNLSVSLIRTKAREAGAMIRLRPRDGFLPQMPEEDAHFWKAVRSLPRRQAQVIALHYLEDRPIADIALVLGCAENTVKVHLHKGRQRLARKLDEMEERS